MLQVGAAQHAETSPASACWKHTKTSWLKRSRQANTVKASGLRRHAGVSTGPSATGPGGMLCERGKSRFLRPPSCATDLEPGSPWPLAPRQTKPFARSYFVIFGPTRRETTRTGKTRPGTPAPWDLPRPATSPRGCHGLKSSEVHSLSLQFALCSDT